MIIEMKETGLDSKTYKVTKDGKNMTTISPALDYSELVNVLKFAAKNNATIKAASVGWHSFQPIKWALEELEGYTFKHGPAYTGTASPA